MSDSSSSSDTDMEVDKKAAPIDTSDHQDDLAKIINFLKTNKNRTASGIAIKKHLKIKAIPRRIEINNCLKLAIKNNVLEQATSKGVNGSFKLPQDNKKKKVNTKSDAKKSNESPEY